MPWYCGACRHFNPNKYGCCPGCGRPRKGRLCRACKHTAPKGAVHCPQCGSARLTEAAVQAPLPFSAPVRLGLLCLGLLLGWLAVGLLTPVFLAVWRWLCALTLHLGFGMLVFWIITGLLPAGWGKAVRRAAWSLLQFVVGFLVRLVR